MVRTSYGLAATLNAAAVAQLAGQRVSRHVASGHLPGRRIHLLMDYSTI
jgi:hypothetical protein